MKRLFIVILIPLLTMSLAAAAKIVFEKTELSFGEVESGKVVDLEFKFKSTGDETLVIKNIGSSCGCTVPKVDKKEYKPGEEGTIPLQFFSKGYTGEVIKTISVSTNDQESKIVRLQIKGNVTLKDFAAVEIIGPDEIEFKDVAMGKKYTQIFKFKNSGTIELRLVEVSLVPELSVEFSKKILAPSEIGEIILTFKPLEVGRFAGFPRIRTNAYRERTLIFKVKAEVK